MTDIPPVPVDQTDLIQTLVGDDFPLVAETYIFSGQVDLPGGTNLIGVSPNRSVLGYDGDRRDGCLFLPAGAWGSVLAGFALNNLIADRQGTGIRSGATDLRPAIGTQSGMSRLEDIWIDGFEYGIRYGNIAYNSSSSEVTGVNLRFANCDVGMQIETQNSLNYKLDQLGVMLSRIGLSCVNAGFINLNVGSFSGVTDCVWDVEGAGTYTGTGLRAENCGYFFRLGNALATSHVTLIGCGTGANQRPDKVDVKVSGGVNLHVIGGLYDGSFLYEGFHEPEPGYGTIILDGVRTRRPVLLTGTPGTKCRYEARNCAIVDSNNEVIQRVHQSGILGDVATVP